MDLATAWMSAVAVTVSGMPAPASHAPAPPAAVFSSTRALVTWTPGEVRCEGGIVVKDASLRRPLNSLTWYRDGKAPGETLRFDIAASGRAISIVQARGGNEDLGPALAASRFPQVARSGCTVTYSAVSQPLATAGLGELVSYTVSPISGALPREGWARLRASGNCEERPQPSPLLRAFPDFDKIPATPGVRDWSMISYDTDADGRPQNVRVAFGNGNAALDAASVEAVRKSRFTGGARKGCSYRYWRSAKALPAPPAPQEDAYKAEVGSCPGRREWATAPRLRFPPAYARRWVEGWAIVSYDVAPWGEIGNVKVLETQPSDEFGRTAAQIMQTAKLAPSAQGASGCMQTLKFVMRPGDQNPDEAAAVEDEAITVY